MIHWMYKVTALLVSLIALPLYGDSNYLFCIEGGGSKTILQALNKEGKILSLIKDGIKNDRIETTGSNINLIGLEGVQQVLNSLFEGVFLQEGDLKIDLRCLMPDSRIIAGMAGAGLLQNKQSLVSLIEGWGIRSDCILVMSDAEMALQLVHGEGIILIAGTGSICLGKRDEALFRVGGLGRVLGDEGSGYQIGLQALKAALAEEYGWGIATNLTSELKELFLVSDLKNLIPKINLGEISPSKIASSAPLVFNQAWEQDKVAEEIINQAAGDLCDLLTKMLNISQLSDCEVHLWGGIFKNKHSKIFIQIIREKLPEAYRDLKMINKSQDNPAVLFAIQNYCRVADLLQSCP